MRGNKDEDVEEATLSDVSALHEDGIFVSYERRLWTLLEGVWSAFGRHFGLQEAVRSA